MNKPNILHIFVDQQRFDTIGAINNPVIQTPGLDRLREMGVAFTNAYTPSPVCVAARCSMIYGQYPPSTGCYENGIMPEDGRASFMSALAGRGYIAHGIGKCHFTPDRNALRGFTSRETQEEQGNDCDYIRYVSARGYQSVLEPHGVRSEMYYIPQPSQLLERDHPTQWIGDRSVSFIRERAGGAPWYLFSSFIHPHPPFAPPSPWHKKYRAAQMPLPKLPAQAESLITLANRFQNRYKYRDNGFDLNLARTIRAYYYACISFVDHQIARMLDVLEDTGQLDNTLIIFTSDHGELLGDYQCYGKRSMHDSCARIPMLAYMKGALEGGGTCERAVSLVDIAPTVLAVSGAEITDHALDGESLIDVFNGNTGREFVFAQISVNCSPILAKTPELARVLSDPEAARAMFSTYMLASERYKYFYSAADGQEYLFDKRSDPLETRNVADIQFYAGEARRIKRALIRFLEERGETGGLEGGDFKIFPSVQLTNNPDAALLVQDKYVPWANAER